MQRTWSQFIEKLQSLPNEERIVIGLVGIACLVAIAIYCIRRVRGQMRQPLATTADHLSEFRRMRESGAIDDKEFDRVVRSMSQSEGKKTKEIAQELPADAEKKSDD